LGGVAGAVIGGTTAKQNTQFKQGEDKTIHDYKKQLINIGMPLKPDGEVDFYKLENGSSTSKMNVYKNVVENSDWYKDYKYLIWLHKESFDEVINAVDELKQTVKDNISA
jgi:hypothetical protein